MPSWVQVRQPDGTYKLVPREEYEPTPRRRHWQIMPDLPDYESPVSGRLVSGRKQRRDDLARTGSRPYEPGERQEFLKRRRESDRRFEARVNETIERIGHGRA